MAICASIIIIGIKVFAALTSVVGTVYELERLGSLIPIQNSISCSLNQLFKFILIL